MDDAPEAGKTAPVRGMGATLTTVTQDIAAAERQSYRVRWMAVPLLLFAGLILLWLATELAILAAPVWLALSLTIPGGIVIGMLFIVGHDAAHNSFTRSRGVNQIVGRIAFLPSAHAFSLWDLSHNRTHHRYNNIAGIDYVWEPMTAEAFRAASPVRRALYAFHRSPAGVPFYYLTELWARRLFVPLPGAIGRARPVYWLDGALVAGFALVWMVAVAAVGHHFGKSPVLSVLLGVVIPFLFWNGFMSFIIFLHHTHPAIPWFPDEASWTEARGAVSGTTHVRFMQPFHWLVLNIMDHNAHHLASGVPLYHLPRMQRAMEAAGGVVAWDFSWRAYARICGRCKLYDYAAKRWLGFEAAAIKP
jgi:omega-6 fatty acid desaturase (delta-12 desaturase)